MQGMGLPDGVREYLLAAGAIEAEIDRVKDDDALFTPAGDVWRDIKWMPIEDVAAITGVSDEDVERYRLLVGLTSRDNLVREWTVSGLETYRVAASLVGDQWPASFSGHGWLRCHGDARPPCRHGQEAEDI
jgi:hypothetical protein